MKWILFFCSCLIMQSLQAQTKKIALRSHSGSNADFSLYIPDEFGMVPPKYRIPTKKINPKSTTPIPTIESSCVKDSAEQELLEHKLPTTKQPKKKAKSKKKNKHYKKYKRYKPRKKSPCNTVSTDKPPMDHPTASSESIGRKMNFVKHQPETFTMNQYEMGSTGYLFWLLTVPAVLAFLCFNKLP